MEGGNGWSWVDQTNVGTAGDTKGEWRRGRPTKHHRSGSRRWEVRSTNPFPLQDNWGRCEAAQQLYQHAGELVLAHHYVVAQGMACHYPNIESGKAKSLNNQVLCMISEYHLTCHCQGPSCTSPVLLEAAEDLLPSQEEYLADGGSQGTRDFRVTMKARTLRVAVWVHRLDMAVTEDETASWSMEVTRHGRGPPLEYLLAPQTSSLTFEEVVQWVLTENRYKTESSLYNVKKLQAWFQMELKDLSGSQKGVC